jgi:hypothetical protein
MVIPAIMLVFLMYSNFGQNGYSQVDRTGVIWVVPNRPDAFPANGNRTGNFGLNIAFDDFHVIQYSFLDSLYMGDLLDKQPIYEIKLQSEFADFEETFTFILHYCFDGFFRGISLPYYHPFPAGGPISSTDNGSIHIGFENIDFNYSLLPSSNTSSYNPQINNILSHYNINNYSLNAVVLNNGDTIIRYIHISCKYENTLPLYYELLSIINLYYDFISLASFSLFSDTQYPCGSYSGIGFDEKSKITVFPNPTYNEIVISGVLIKSIILYDNFGKEITSKIDYTENILNISDLSNGMYFLKVISIDGAIYTQKIIKL